MYQLSYKTSFQKTYKNLDSKIQYLFNNEIISKSCIPDITLSSSSFSCLTFNIDLENIFLNCCGKPFSQLQIGLPSTTLWPNDFG